MTSETQTVLKMSVLYSEPSGLREYAGYKIQKGATGEKYGLRLVMVLQRITQVRKHTAVCWAYHNKRPLTGQLKQQEVIFSV